MKKIVCTMLCIMLLFGLSACGGNVSEVKTHNVESESYSEEDIKAAVSYTHLGCPYLIKHLMF